MKKRNRLKTMSENDDFPSAIPFSVHRLQTQTTLKWKQDLSLFPILFLWPQNTLTEPSLLLTNEHEFLRNKKQHHLSYLNISWYSSLSLLSHQSIDSVAVKSLASIMYTLCAACSCFCSPCLTRFLFEHEASQLFRYLCSLISLFCCSHKKRKWNILRVNERQQRRETGLCQNQTFTFFDEEEE